MQNETAFLQFAFDSTRRAEMLRYQDARGVAGTFEISGIDR
jgi:hypothetical protein